MTMSIKKKLVIIALSGTMLASGIVAAEGFDLDPKVYVGAEVSGNRYNSPKTLTDNKGLTLFRTDNKPLFGKNGAGVTGFIGTRLNEYAGLEAGYNVLATPKIANANGKIRANNAYVDAMGYLPIADQIDAIGSLGVGFLSTSVSVNNFNVAGTNQSFSQKSSKAGVRAGAGLAYKFDDCMGARFMVRYQQGNKHIKSITSAGVGLYYQF